MDAKRVQLLLAQAAVDAALEAPSAGGAKNAAVVATEKRLARERCAMSCFRNYLGLYNRSQPTFSTLDMLLALLLSLAQEQLIRLPERNWAGAIH